MFKIYNEDPCARKLLTGSEILKQYFRTEDAGYEPWGVRKALPGRILAERLDQGSADALSEHLSPGVTCLLERPKISHERRRSSNFQETRAPGTEHPTWAKLKRNLWRATWTFVFSFCGKIFAADLP